MKKQVLLTGIAFLSLFLFSLCSNSKKKSEIPIDPMLLHDNGVKIWVLSEKWVNDELQDISTCMDEHLLLAKDQTGMQIFGETDTHHTDTLTVDHFTYNVIETEGTITFSEFHESHIMAAHPIMDIAALTEEKMELCAQAEEGGEKVHTKLVFVRAVDPNPDASEKNTMLTNGSVKVWKVTNVLVNGEPTNIPCRRDDIMLWATNGMAVKIFGDVHCVPGDTTNNDIIRWEFIEEESRIVKSDMHAKWQHETGSELVIDDTIRIVKLTPEEFTWEGTSLFNGIAKNVTITEVPAY
ncbi:MAG TPA: hypothetical protein PLK12_17615 [Prolixibacteraceae bacterium]|nr:hypothetical protein [Prolixibacteraceae bacterium]